MAPLSVSEVEQHPIVYINGKKHDLPAGRGEATLLQFLREKGLTGTKLGCGEGGCGACTVMVSQWDKGEVVHRAVNACLCPLYAVEGMHVVTVEGIGNTRDGLHPVQQRLAQSHGSQCGFCTPGFVMSMYALLRSSAAPPSELDIEEALGGNLCRCTGYRPILDAFKTFAQSDPTAYSEEAIAASKGLLPSGDSHLGQAHSSLANGSPDGVVANAHASGNGVGNGFGAAGANGVCPSSGLPCACQQAGGQGCGKGGCSGSSCSKGGCSGAGCSKGDSQAKISRTVEPIFPPELKSRQILPLHMPGEFVNWYRPITLQQLLQLKQEFPASKVVVGNTEVGIEMKFKDCKYPVIISPTHVPEMNQVNVTEAGVEVGASVTLTHMMKFLKRQIALLPPHQTATFRAINNQLKWFAGNQIRNVSSVGGNIVTGSPISDLNPIWMASGAAFTAMSVEKGERCIPASKFFIGYRQVDLAPSEVLYKVFIPFTRQYEYVKEFKQAPRREDDIAIVNAGMRVKLSRDTTGSWVVEEAALGFGGVAARTMLAHEASAALVGCTWDQATLQAALSELDKDIVISPNAPGGKVEFRRSLAASFLFKFFTHVSLALEADTAASNEGPYVPSLSPAECSAAETFERPPARGVQFFAQAAPQEVVGQPYQHMAADLQVTGEATYTDDIKLSTDALVAAVVTSTKPHARIKCLDGSAALAVPGVAGFFTAKDVPGSNMIGPVVQDEEVFATEYVTAVGQIIAVVVAETEAIARRAAKLVVVEYEELPAIMSCEEAIEAGAFYSYNNQLACGDVDASFASGKCDHVVEGTLKLGGQEHFYLETNACCVIPQENNEFLLFASTQAPAKHQKTVAQVLGLPAARVVSKTKRLGGGFGGKETRSIFVHAAIAVPAYHLQRPVKIALDRDEDMQMTGQRHAFLAHYKVGFTHEGLVEAVDIQLYNNAGNSWDLSASIMDRALLHSDCVYKVPNMRASGRLCKINQSSNTAFRGFGGPQGMMFAEMWMDRVARVVGRPAHEVRELNMYKEGDVTHFGQLLEHCQVRSCWERAKHDSDYESRYQQVQQYNRQHRWRKRGLALMPTKFGISFTTKFLNQAGALVHVYLDGTVLVTHGGVEMGQGLHTKMAQVAAQSLGLPLSSVFISETSTDKVPNASPTAASASSDMYGAAILDACEQINSRLAPFRQRMAGKSFKEVINAAYLERVDLSAHGFYKTPDITGFGGDRPFNYFCYGAAVSEVELDTLTGDFHILRTDIVMDVGNPINPAIDIGQVEGGFVQGMGWVCIEELMWGDSQHPWIRPGQLFTRGPGTYKIPTANDIPIDFRVQLLQNAPNPRAIHSSKAVGEPPFHLGASVFFALKDAVYAARKDAGHDGWFQLDAPCTPERLRMLCADPIAARYAGPDIRPKISC